MVEQGWQHKSLTQLIETETMHERKQIMAEMSDGVIALPGGCGTMEELLEIITWKQLGIYLNPIIILNIDGIKIGIIIDRIERVVHVKNEEIKPPPQMLTGIGSEYIHGVIRQESGYLIILDIRRVFNPKDLQKLVGNDY
jgi:hypothetical protein